MWCAAIERTLSGMNTLPDRAAQLILGSALPLVGCLLVAAVIAWKVRPRFGGSFRAAFAVLGSLAAAIGLTLADRIAPGEVLRLRVSLSGLSWWTYDWSRLPERSIGDREFGLNILLFVPAGAALSWHLRRSAGRVMALLVVLSFAIETLQAVAGLGRADPRDWVANSLGAALGAGATLVFAGLTGLNGPGPAGARGRWTSRQREAVVGSVVALGCVGALGTAAWATDYQADVLAELRREYGNLTSADVARAIGSTDGGAERFWAQVSVRPDSVATLEDGELIVYRYPAQQFGWARCVFAIWTPDEATFVRVNGDRCDGFFDNQEAWRYVVTPD